MSVRYAIIIPACNEELCLDAVLRELQAASDPARFAIVVGVNSSSDGTLRIAKERGALAAETPQRGYGHGCLAAIELARKTWPEVEAFVFFAADGANDPADIAALVAAREAGCNFVLGCRTWLPRNWLVMGPSHVFANTLLALWCGFLTGHFFRDIGPLRIIERTLFERMRLVETLYGWTIEAQIRAVQLGAGIREISVRERHRLAGEQKVSRVSWRHSLRIGTAIIAAGWRTRFRVRAD